MQCQSSDLIGVTYTSAFAEGFSASLAESSVASGHPRQGKKCLGWRALSVVLGAIHASEGRFVIAKQLRVDKMGGMTHESQRKDSIFWMEILGGRLLNVQELVDRHLLAVSMGASDSVGCSGRFVADTFPRRRLGVENENAAGQLGAALTSQPPNPLGVCPNVRNDGQPAEFSPMQSAFTLLHQRHRPAHLTADACRLEQHWPFTYPKTDLLQRVD